MKSRATRTAIALHCTLSLVLALAAGTHIVAIYKSLQPIRGHAPAVAVVTFNLALAGLVLFRLGRRDVHDVLLLTFVAYLLWSLFSFVIGRDCGCVAIVAIHPLIIVAFDAAAAVALFLARRHSSAGAPTFDATLPNPAS